MMIDPSLLPEPTGYTGGYIGNPQLGGATPFPSPYSGVPSLSGAPAPTMQPPSMISQPAQLPTAQPAPLPSLPPMQSPGVQSGLFNNPPAAGAPSPTAGGNTYAGIPGLSMPGGFAAAPTGASPNPFIDQLTQMIQSGGNPINQTAPWQAMIDAQQRNIQENAAQLAEQFNVTGNRTSTGFGTAMTDFYNQATRNQNTLLGQMTAQAGESAAGRMFGAESQLSGQDFQSLMDQYNTANQAAMGMYQGQMGTVSPFLNYALGLQGLGIQGGTNLGDLFNQTYQTGGQLGQQQYMQQQNAISNAYQEFLRTQPFNNPMMQMMYSGAFNYPQMITPGYQPGMLGSMMQGAGGILGGIGALAPLLI